MTNLGLFLPVRFILATMPPFAGRRRRANRGTSQEGRLKLCRRQGVGGYLFAL